jgi:large subunit ribosomal protein L23
MSYDQSSQKDLFDIIKYPILTLKAIRLIEQNQYVFAVDSNVDKSSIKMAIEQLFNVKVVSVNTSMFPVKKNRVGKYLGKKALHKKALVKLTLQDSISLFDEE